jgi:hypothetical protein
VLYQQEMEHLDLPRSYRTILGPSSVLQLLTEPCAAASALRRILDHLQPGRGIRHAVRWPLPAAEQIVISRRARYVILPMAPFAGRGTIRLPARLDHRTH